MVAKTRRAVKRNRKQTKKRSRRGGAPPTLARNKTQSQALAQKKRMAREREMRAKIANLTAAVEELRISNSKIAGFDATAEYLARNPTVKTSGALNALIAQQIPEAMLNTPLQMIVSIGVKGRPFQLDIGDVMIRGPHRDGPVYSVDPYAALFFMVWLAEHGLMDRESMPYELRTSEELFEFAYTDASSNSHVDIVLRPMPRTPGQRMPEESLAGRMRALTLNPGFPDDASANPFSRAEFRPRKQTPPTATKSQKPSLTAAQRSAIIQDALKESQQKRVASRRSAAAASTKSVTAPAAAAPVSASVEPRIKTKKEDTRTDDEKIADAEKNQTKGANKKHLQAALRNLIKKYGDGLDLEHQAGVFPHSVERLKNTVENGTNAQIKDRITKIVKRLDTRLEEIKKKSSN